MQIQTQIPYADQWYHFLDAHLIKKHAIRLAYICICRWKVSKKALSIFLMFEHKVHSEGRKRCGFLTANSKKSKVASNIKERR